MATAIRHIALRGQRAAALGSREVVRDIHTELGEGRAGDRGTSLPGCLPAFLPACLVGQ